MKFVIVTGMSGAGKSSAVNVLEDMGYYVIDNIPPRLIPEFAKICAASQGRIENIAVVADIRGIISGGGESAITDLLTCMEDLRTEYDVNMVFLDANDAALINRYKETRRAHPLDYTSKGSIADAVAKERMILRPVIKAADMYFDTSRLSSNQFKREFRAYFTEDTNKLMTVRIMSFGFKYGTPAEADYIFDTRFLPNPFYIPELKNLTGKDKAVRDYVMSFKEAQILENQIGELVTFIIPLCRTEGRSSLTIAFGCTGGQHRSVTFAKRLGDILEENGIECTVIHRELV